MLTPNLAKIDKFMIVLTITLIVMAAVVTFAFRGIFSAYLTAYEIGQGLDNELNIDKEKLEQAHKWAFSDETISLQMIFDKPKPKNEEE